MIPISLMMPVTELSGVRIRTTLDAGRFLRSLVPVTPNGVCSP